MPFRSCKPLKCGRHWCRQLKPAELNLVSSNCLGLILSKDVHLLETLTNNFLQAPVWVFNPFLLYGAIMVGIASKEEWLIL